MSTDETKPPALPGEVWRGTLVENDEEHHVGVAREGDDHWPLFFWRRWREPAPKFGHRIMAAWALHERARVEKAEAVVGLFVELERLDASVSNLRARGCDGAADKKEEEYGPLRARLDEAILAMGVEP